MRKLISATTPWTLAGSLGFVRLGVAFTALGWRHPTSFTSGAAQGAEKGPQSRITSLAYCPRITFGRSTQTTLADGMTER